MLCEFPRTWNKKMKNKTGCDKTQQQIACGRIIYDILFRRTEKEKKRRRDLSSITAHRQLYLVSRHSIHSIPCVLTVHCCVMLSMHYRVLVSLIVFIGTQWRTMRLRNKRINLFVCGIRWAYHLMQHASVARRTVSKWRLPRAGSAHSRDERVAQKTVYTFRRNTYSVQSFCSFHRDARVFASNSILPKTKSVRFEKINK